MTQDTIRVDVEGIGMCDLPVRNGVAHMSTATVRDIVNLSAMISDDVSESTTIKPRSKEFADVGQFLTKFGMLQFDTPGHLSAGKLKERIELLQEELDEFIEAAGFKWSPGHGYVEYDPIDNPGAQHLGNQADALVDLVYIALGTAHMLGLPWDWLWDDVQRANMAKVRGVKPGRDHAVDVIKPDGWLGPQTNRILELAGYKHADWWACGPQGDETWNLIEENCRDDTQRDK